MTSPGSLHLQIDVNYNEETQSEVEAGGYRLPPDNQKLGLMENISNIWSEPPPNHHLHVYVTVPTTKRIITPPEVALGIEIIDEKINEELKSLRVMVEMFLKSPEPPTWIPPDDVTSSDRDFLTNLRLPTYRNGNPSLLFHNLDVYDDKEIKMIFGPGQHQYVVINCSLNTSQHVQAGAFATHLAREKPVAYWRASRNTGDSTLLQPQMPAELASQISKQP